ncbi:LysE family translocator [Streptomyces sp. NPDC057575]|uniref:LysE family translocator n=1 Tax=unclassified Streptomyces TaxID=2593676 RepID=UPI0036AEEA04
MAMLINMAPGPDALLVVRTSMTQGRRGGQAAALGILTGCAGWGIATAVGLAAVLTAGDPGGSPPDDPAGRGSCTRTRPCSPEAAAHSPPRGSVPCACRWG